MTAAVAAGAGVAWELHRRSADAGGTTRVSAGAAPAGAGVMFEHTW